MREERAGEGGPLEGVGDGKERRMNGKETRKGNRRRGVG